MFLNQKNLRSHTILQKNFSKPPHNEYRQIHKVYIKGSTGEAPLTSVYGNKPPKRKRGRVESRASPQLTPSDPNFKRRIYMTSSSDPGSGSSTSNEQRSFEVSQDAPDPFSTPEPEAPIIEINETVNLRPDLTLIGIDEVDRGICEDTFENRQILRRAKFNWIPVYATNGVPTGLIQAISHEMATEKRIISLAEKKPILTDPTNKNSDYITGLDLLAEEAADYIVPPWVIGATRAWVKEQTDPVRSSKRKPAALPTRCTNVKDDGIRCQLWSSGRLADDGLCRIHLRSVKHRPGDDIERARQKLFQAAPYAVDVLEDMMSNAESEPVKLKAATEILDRAGVRGGMEIDTNVSLEVRPAASIIAERLNKLATNAIEAAARLNEAGILVTSNEVDPNLEDAGGSEGASTSNEETDENIVDAELVDEKAKDNE